MQWGETLNILKPLNTILAKVLLRDITDYHCIQESGVWILHAATVKPLVASAHFSRGSPQMTQLLVQRKCAQRANKEQRANTKSLVDALWFPISSRLNLWVCARETKNLCNAFVHCVHV